MTVGLMVGLAHGYPYGTPRIDVIRDQRIIGRPSMRKERRAVEEC